MMQLLSEHLRIVCLAVVLMGLFTMTVQAAMPACGTTLTDDTKLAPDTKADSDISSKISGGYYQINPVSRNARAISLYTGLRGER
jgi:hypothetical protein